MSEILDSGERTEFTTGAVRDLHGGKGRFDLLPMCVLMRLAQHYEMGALKYSDRNWEKGIPAHSFVDSAFRHLVKYCDGWTDEDHLIAAIWNLCGLAWTEEKKPEMMDLPFRPEEQKQCGNCKYYIGVHGASGHAPCNFWGIGAVLDHDYCSRYKRVVKED